MRHTFTIIQMMVVGQVTDNIRKMGAMVREAQGRFRAELTLFPETCMAGFLHGMTRGLRAETAEVLDGPSVNAVREPAARSSIWTVSDFYEHTEAADSENRSYNSALILDDRREVHGRYRKTHLYDAFGYRESDDYLRDEQLFRPVDSPLGRLGPFVCCELRFPKVARVARAGSAEILLMPSTWVKDDLEDEHFHTLLKARAVENTCCLLAANQYSKIRMGESAAIDPMDIVAASAGERETVFPAYLDSERFREVREKLPSFEDRREEPYGSLPSNTMNRCQSEI